MGNPSWLVKIGVLKPDAEALTSMESVVEEMATAAVNRTGFSYWSFRELLNKLSKKIKDEAALYAAVCATALLAAAIYLLIRFVRWFRIFVRNNAKD